VAEALGYRHLDTGAMYRALTLAARRRGVEPTEPAALAALLGEVRIDLEPGPEGGRVLLDGEDVSRAIREPEITRQVGPYADQPAVRRALVRQQQALGALGGVVAEGRDLGTAVFPQADLKVWMTASLAERARRRHAELTAQGTSIALERVTEDIRARDAADARRDYGASREPGSTVELDTTGLTLDQQAERIVAWARARGA
jgi:cytidylate kinase